MVHLSFPTGRPPATLPTLPFCLSILLTLPNPSTSSSQGSSVPSLPLPPLRLSPHSYYFWTGDSCLGGFVSFAEKGLYPHAASTSSSTHRSHSELSDTHPLPTCLSHLSPFQFRKAQAPGKLPPTPPPPHTLSLSLSSSSRPSPPHKPMSSLALAD